MAEAMDIGKAAPGAKNETSHSKIIVTQIESILSAPDEFTSTTPEKVITPLLHQIQEGLCNDNDLRDRISRIRRWCAQLNDACRAAHARDTVTEFLTEINAWDEWSWEDELDPLQEKRSRLDEMKSALNELPIEFLKERVKGNFFVLRTNFRTEKKK
jgi:hypothetical protein